MNYDSFNKKWALTLLVSLVFVSCGGGGGGSSEVKPEISVVNNTDLFGSPLLMQNLTTKYEGLKCENNVYTQSIVPVDLNGDSRLDLLVFFYCSSRVGEVSFKSVPNNVIALLQSGNLQFRDATEEVFGSSVLDVDGVALQRYVKYDFNRDGRDDIAVVVNMEDGRFDWYKQAAPKSVVIMSATGGRYTIEKIGSAKLNTGIAEVENARGTKDIVLIPSGERLVYDNEWKISSTLDLNFNNETKFLPSKSAGVDSNYGFFHVNATDVQFRQKMGEEWRLIYEYSFPQREVPFLTYYNTLTSVTLFEFAGRKLIQGCLFYSCLIKRAPKSDYELLAMMIGKDATTYIEGTTFSEATGGKNISKLISFEVVGNKIVLNLLNIKGEMSASSPNNIVCEDVNGDGYDDIIVYTETDPEIYVNNKDLTFRRLSYGGVLKDVQSLAGRLYVDLDGDGIKDLVFAPVSVNFGEGTTSTRKDVGLFVKRGLRNIRETDLMQ